MAKKKILIALTFFAFVGCSKKTIPLDAYKNLNKDTASNLGQLKAAAIPLIVKKSRQSELKLSDSILKYGANNIVYSNFKVFAIPLKQNQKYRLTVSSICDCVGFKKYMFIPLTAVTDSKGLPIEMESKKDHFDYRYGPLSLNKIYEINTAEADDFEIIVYSDNKNLDQNIHQYLISDIGLTVNIKTSLIGKFHILVEEIKK